MKRISILSLAGTIVLAGAILTGQVFGQVEDTDANGVPMKLYPVVYKDPVQTQTQPEAKTKKTVLSAAPGQDTPNGGPVPNPQYTLIDLGFGYANGINSVGQVVGNGDVSGGAEAVLWQNGSVSDLGSLGGNGGVANGINSVGQVVGSASTIRESYIDAFIWQNGSMQDLGLGGYSYGNGINDAGQVVGSSDYHGAFLWQNGSMQYLGDLGTQFGDSSYAYGINSVGQVVGYAGTSTDPYHAFLWQNGAMQDLGTLGGRYSFALGINSAGQIAGYAYISGNSYNHAFLWQNGSMQDLGTLAGGYSEAWGINSVGQIVGNATTVNGDDTRAFLWQNGTMYDLNSLLFNQNSGWVLESARAINDKGQIVGSGRNPSGETRAFLLNPLPVGASDASSMVQPALPTYGVCPVPGQGKDSLVVITHGRIPPGDDPVKSTAWINSMSSSMAQYIADRGLNNWQVNGYNWAQGAQALLPATVLHHADQEGKQLGDSIVAQGNWKHIHFIAHSAGAGLIQKATEVIKASLPNTVIHCTFLDPYDGAVLEKVGDYGNGSDWADSYFSRDLETGGFIEQPLIHAYNVDVTTLDSQAVQSPIAGYISKGSIGAPCYKTESSHGWPIDFYFASIASNPPSNYEGMGVSWSEEAGNLALAAFLYPPGNATSADLNRQVRILGPVDPACSLLVPIPTYQGISPGFTANSTIKSITGTLQTFPGSIKAWTGSPVWIATVITDTNGLNRLSFDAEFTSMSGSHGLLSVYWDTNLIGLLDEAAVQSGFQHYALQFPNSEANTSHVLGFHVDPFTGTQSTITLTNIVVGSVGVVQPFTLAVTTNTSSGSWIYRLAGQSANYTIQASTNLFDWSNIAILANTNGTVDFIDPNSTNYSYRFYRGVAQ